MEESIRILLMKAFVRLKFECRNYITSNDIRPNVYGIILSSSGTFSRFKST